jgi:tetratricopeptide (TPR) repeat protein
MFAKIISVPRGALFVCALAVAVAGCTPAGPGALLKGKKFLDHGNFAAAVAQLKTATTLLATNASAWNYYGVALQRNGQPDEAASAYARALECNRDLVEAHFNLGSLWLEQNKPDAAKTEFTAYTLRRANDPAGWLKLGSAQLRLGETVPAEKCFSTVLALRPADAEAYNGLGLARIQRGKPRDAAQFFAAAVSARPDFAAALLNLATTSQQYLRDNKTALENYRAYLALTPRPANWEDVNALVASLEQAQAALVAAATPAPAAKASPPAPAAVEPKPQPKPVVIIPSRPPVVTKPIVAKVVNSNPPPVKAVAVPPPQVVKLSPAPQIVTTPKTTVAPAPVTPESLEVPMPEEPKKTGFWHKLFGGNKNDSPPAAQPANPDVTPLPANPAPEVRAAAPPVYAAPPPAVFTRYNYVSPPAPAAGDRRSASGAFTKARVFEQAENWTEALRWYQTAAEIDPAWFEAQYNTGVLAHKLRNYPLALPSYENALAIQPDSTDARYNFALALKAAGHAPDAADELKKILAANPGEVRAHLALANLCAQSLHDPAQARTHYLKVLELEPDNAQAADIRFWLSANAK